MAKFIEVLSEALAGNAFPRTMNRLAEERTPIRIEVEHSDVSFYTVLSLRPEVVLLSRPTDLDNRALAARGVLRFVVPDGTRNVVRLVIRDPHFERERGDAVIVCEMPEEFAEKTKRSQDRFNTSRFKNLRLLVPQVEADFRIIDISMAGCKAFVRDLEHWDVLAPGIGMRFARVAAGEKVRIDLAMLTPRLLKPPTASFAWEVSPVGPSQGLLQHLVNTLHGNELRRLKIKEKDILAPGRG